MHRGFALASFLLISTAAAVSARAADIALPEDEGRIVTFQKPIATVFIANPVVADVNMIDATHAYVLGKAFGATNFIAMDAKGQPVATNHITVLGSSHLVTLNRGNAQFTFACASSRCEVAPTPGDARSWHDDNMGEVNLREDMGAKASSASEGH